MTDQSNSVAAVPPTQNDVRDAFQALYDELGQAYWAATTMDTKDRIYGIEEIVYDLVMQLDKAQLDSGTALYNQVKAQVQVVNGKIDQLKKDIDSIIHAVNVAADVASAIDKALTVAGKFFAL